MQKFSGASSRNSSINVSTAMSMFCNMYLRWAKDSLLPCLCENNFWETLWKLFEIFIVRSDYNLGSFSFRWYFWQIDYRSRSKNFLVLLTRLSVEKKIKYIYIYMFVTWQNIRKIVILRWLWNDLLIHCESNMMKKICWSKMNCIRFFEENCKL